MIDKIMQMLGGPQNFQNQFNQFQQQINQQGINPQQQVQQLLNSGQMSQQQFNQLRMIANALTGKEVGQMTELTAPGDQVVNPGESVVFTQVPVPCNRGFVRHRLGSGNVLLAGKVFRKPCGCFPNNAQYALKFGANIGVPTGGTAEAITIAIAIDGSTIPSSQMEVTPAAVEQFFNVNRDIVAEVWSGCCETITIRNTSSQPITVRNPSLDISRPDLAMSR